MLKVMRIGRLKVCQCQRVKLMTQRRTVKIRRESFSELRGYLLGRVFLRQVFQEQAVTEDVAPADLTQQAEFGAVV